MPLPDGHGEKLNENPDMQSRREFCQSVAGAAALAMIPSGLSVEPPAEPYRADVPMRELQQRFVNLRFGMFLHFNMATYQDREWGDPSSPASLFHPTALDTDQWAAAAKAAGMGFACLTTKHHDGFPIWATKTKVAHADVDVVRAYVDSFRRAGIRVGLYYSILDLRNDIRHFNVTPEKIRLIKDQLTELLTHYGEIDLLIFDGWDAPWSRITYEEVPFAEIYALVKRLQPNCLISELNASEYPPSALYYTDIKAFEQNAGQTLPATSTVPAQSCVTLTDGWFWKEADRDAELKPTKRIVEEWLVPQNARHCNLILNAPPNREGRLAPNVVARLEEIGRTWRNPGLAEPIHPHLVITTKNLATGRPIHANSSPDTYGPDLANDGKFGNSWCPDYGVAEGELVVELDGSPEVNTLVFAEPVGRWEDYAKSRIASFEWHGWDGQKWVELAQGETPAPVEIRQIRGRRVTKVRLRIHGSRDMPHISELGVYREPGYS